MEAPPLTRPMPDREAWARLDDPDWTLEERGGRVLPCEAGGPPTAASWKRSAADHQAAAA